MDPVTLGAVLAAVAGGAGGALGSQAWNGLCALVRRHFRHGMASEAQGAASANGEAALAALEQHPGDAGPATELAGVLIARAGTDREFQRELAAWWEQARQVRLGDDVSNTISGGVQYGPVLQGRDFTGLNFGAQAGPAREK
jgi:hypothetical protein